jgi:putative aldouronate transport system permease protein
LKQENLNGNWLYHTLIYVVLAITALLCFLPFLKIFAGSFTTNDELMARRIVFIPHHFSLDAYRTIFSNDVIPHSLLVTVYITVLGTLINLFFTAITAYALSRRKMKAQRAIMLLIVFTMLFEGGMIPTYLVVKNLHLLNTLWAVMVPNAINAFNLILMRNFFMQLPEELFDAAKIDGCGEMTTLWKIVMPLSKAALATFALFYSVAHWNSFFTAFLYINDLDKWPIQVWLRQLIVMAVGDFSDIATTADAVPTESLKMATIVVATLPILLVYPFLQKHFTKGIMVGSVKG